MDSRETRIRAAEIKFVVDPVLGNKVREWARANLDPDPHGRGSTRDQYRITSVYFDTDNYDVFHRRGSFGRCKFRARRYGESDAVFLERKLTRPGLVTKRRTLVPIDVASHNLNGGEPEHGWSGEWFGRRLKVRQLRPVSQVSYVRTARVVEADNGGLHRLTLDEDIRVATAENLAFAAETGLPVLDRQVILEMKYSRGFPPAFQRLIDEFALVPQSASKYRLGLAMLRREGL